MEALFKSSHELLDSVIYLTLTFRPTMSRLTAGHARQGFRGSCVTIRVSERRVCCMPGRQPRPTGRIALYRAILGCGGVRRATNREQFALESRQFAVGKMSTPQLRKKQGSAMSYSA